MGRIIGQLIIIGLVYYGFQAGWFTSIANYFKDSYNKARQEQVIENSDGTITTVRYKSFFDLIMDK